MIIILGVLLLLSLFFNIWFWDHYMRVIPLSADKSSMFAIASSCENPRWVCSGQQKLATALEFFQNNRSDSFGVKPPLY
nr:hypothetical protein BHCLPEHB_00060 [Escherichia coli]